MVMSDKYVLEIVRVLKEYFPKDYRYKLIRLWGVEELALKMQNGEVNSEHKMIVEGIKHSIRYC